MEEIHQGELKLEIPLCRVRSSESEKEQPDREILQNAKEMISEIS